jgi:NADP-dependent 3-hydroxy acid dehydrogenase YdfG
MADLCVVVGATGSFGRAVTERLVTRGQRVLAVGRREADLSALAAEVAGVTPCVADISDDGAIETISAALDGPVRMAVFAAGLPVAGSVETVAPSDLARGADIKLGGLLRLVRAVDARLVPGSRIVMFAGSRRPARSRGR